MINAIITKFRSVVDRYFSPNGTSDSISDWYPELISEKSSDEDSWENEVSVARCRNVSDVDVISGALNREGFNIVQSGVGVKSPNDDFNSMFALWSKVPSMFDISGDNNLKQALRLIVRAWRTDGEAFLVRHFYKTESAVPICFEILPVDAIDMSRDNNDDIVRGIRYDKATGRKKGYFFYEDGNNSFKSREIDAGRVIHTSMKKAIGRKRGSPTLAASATSTRDMKQYVDFERLAAKVHSCISFFLKTDSPEAYKKLKEEGKIPLPKFLQPGKVFALPMGTSVANSGQQRPTTSFEPFVQSILQFISTSINHAYPNFSGNYERSSYSAARMATIEERVAFKFFQSELISQVITPVVLMVAQACQIAGHLPPDIDLYAFAYQDTTYLPPGFDWVDPLKEAKSIEILVEKKYMTLTKLLGDKGIDFAKHVEQLKEEAEAMYELEKIYFEIRKMRGEVDSESNAR